MKLKHLLFGALAALVFAACAKNEAPAGTNPGEDGGVSGLRSYVKVDFVMPGNAATRADDAVFEAGSADENQVDSGVLFFFDNGTQVADPFELGDATWSAEEEGTDINIESKSGVIVVLENPLKEPTSVVAVLNATLADLGLSKSSSLADIKAVVKDFSATGAGKFVMSSSAYDGAVDDVAAEIETVYSSRADAEANASVKIPVERVVAKVDVQEKEGGATMNLANGSTAASNTVNIDGEDVTISATIDGWWFDNAASTSLLLKDISDNADADNDADNFRSYWAKPVPGTLTHGALKDAKTGAQYVQENTDADAPTQAVVAATLKVNDKAVKLVKFKGTLYTEDGFAIAVANTLNGTYWTKTEGETVTYETVDTDDFTITYTSENLPTGVELESYEAYAKIDATTDYYVKSGDTYTKVDDLDLGGYVVQRWEDGQTYYFVPIQHDADRTGVVRNHVYKLTVNSINGLGTPVPFKDVDEIIPIVPEETETYISAEIDILAWKIVKQDVDLGK
ncbi:MAG: Mfa1 fimbrilin C-terminal domain-containing protein [Bacteroidales bacterium]|nr:Mfa1 fimbrilin C-terminal domain-containing protein [Bacteroidales bacterium]